MRTSKADRDEWRKRIESGWQPNPVQMRMLLDDVDHLYALVNSPQVDDFLEAVRTEAAHQVERWGEDDRAKKSDADWLWLMTYLSAKAIFGKDLLNSDDGERLLDNYNRREVVAWNGRTMPAIVASEARKITDRFLIAGFSADEDGRDKYLHRIITVAAGAMNWWRHRWPGAAP